MKRLPVFGLLPLTLSACSLTGDYDRPYEQAYRPIEDPVFNPFVLPEDEIEAGDAGPTPDDPPALLDGHTCEAVDSAWPSTALHCMLICQEGRRATRCDPPVPETFSLMLEGICIHLCEEVNRETARQYFVGNSAQEFFCPPGSIELCPASCRLCEGAAVPTDCRSLCDEGDLWRCVGHTAFNTDEELFDLDESDADQELYLQRVIGGAVDACLQLF